MKNDGWGDDWARYADDMPPGIDETVITAFDAMRDYRRLLKDLASESSDPEKFNPSIALCDKLIEELDGWGLNVTLGLEK